MKIRIAIFIVGVIAALAIRTYFVHVLDPSISTSLAVDQFRTNETLDSARRLYESEKNSIDIFSIVFLVALAWIMLPSIASKLIKGKQNSQS